jgi:hypothetical protein
MQDANALVHFRGRMGAAADRGFEPLQQRRHVRAEQSRLEALEQALHREQRIDFSVAEPQAG